MLQCDLSTSRLSWLVESKPVEKEQIWYIMTKIKEESAQHPSKDHQIVPFSFLEVNFLLFPFPVAMHKEITVI